MKFWKYQGAGNDFIMLDQRAESWISREDTRRIEQLCDRRFGIGADGLILLQPASGYDFEMVYFNADGRESSMCGNGGRCIAAFAQDLGVAQGKCRFVAIDGEHEATMTRQPNRDSRAPGLERYWVELKMTDVKQVEKEGDAFILNTGSPHYVRFVENLEQQDMVAEGRAVRYSERFRANGINVNWVELESAHQLRIRTYERGVEDETYACGTGVTAAAIASYLLNPPPAAPDARIAVQAKGGDLSVRFHDEGDGRFSDIWLCGPAMRVFEGAVSEEL